MLAAMRLPGDLPARFDFDLDGRVLAYAVTVALVTGLLVGLVPAGRISGADLDRTLRRSRHGSPGTHGHRIRGVLVVAQTGFCFVLLAAAGLVVRSLFEAERADLGFRAESVLNVHMDVGQIGYTQAQGRAFRSSRPKTTDHTRRRGHELRVHDSDGLIAQEYTALRVLQVRTSMPPEALAPAIERAIRALEPNLPLYDVQSMTQALGSGLGCFPVRVSASSAASLGLLALALAIVGLYGVISYLTSQRTHEIGVRMAIR